MQPAPMGAPQGTAGPLKPRGKRYLRTDRRGSTAVGKTEELGEKKFKTQPCKQKGKEKEGRRYSECQSRVP